MKIRFLIAFIGGSALFSCNNNDSLRVELGLSKQKLLHNGIKREFILYVPNSFTNDIEFPLMLNFHGFGGQAEGFMQNADMRSLAEINNFILVYPQGTLLDEYSHWNPGFDTPDNKSNADDYGFIDLLITRLKEIYNIDLKRVYASGYSNGAFFSYGLACHFSDKIAAIGSVAGTMLAGTYSSCQASAPKAMINIHGTSDFVVPYNGANGTTSIENVLNFWTNLNDSKNESINIFNNIEHYVFTDDIGNSYVEHFKVIDGGHYWDDKLDFNGKNTSNLIWNFVSKYDINGLR